MTGPIADPAGRVYRAGERILRTVSPEFAELDDALGLTELGGVVLSETRHGKNIRHVLVGLLRP